MHPRTPRLCRSAAAALAAALVAVALLGGMPGVDAGSPGGARYLPDTDKVFWFIQTSDLHIGTRGGTDADRLRWLVTTGRSVINPQFVVVTGDLTDSTNGNWLGIPNGPHQAEWDEYQSILAAAGVGPDIYYDLPGNHDAYSDKTFAYYRANSIQGRATGLTQHSWTREFPFGKYHFLGVNSSGNTGAAFSISFPFGDPAGLDAAELSFIDQELKAHTDAALTFVFGHHPVTDTGAADDTWLFYGQEELIAALDGFGASAYNYGHTHDLTDTQFTGNSYTGFMGNGGIRYTSVTSLGKSSSLHYNVIAVDCNAVSSVPQTVNTWPVVLITAPASKYVGSAPNPYAYSVPNSATNPVRALVFDAGTVASVSYRIDASTVWQPMSRVPSNHALWQGTWNASAVAAGEHSLEVRAVGTTTRSHTIRVQVQATTPTPNQPPTAVDDAYSTPAGVTLSVPAAGVLTNDTDADGDALTALLASDPVHGTVALHANGGFTYIPAAGYTGDDSFAYTAHDARDLVSNTATVSLTITAPPPTTETVTISAATYTKRTRTLAVTATSSAQPGVTLTVEGYGQMTWNAKKNLYTYSSLTTTPPATVTVTSTGGGSATLGVKTK
ncbi:MAG TPA: Ig-like domain-containing protein [Longimicrobiales bacterium]|nr:Ig-like domain-containing protein [Longimicrobiales bacterium]